MNFAVSAPGKIILFGEHAVVYGYKGIASSINLRCKGNVITKGIDENLVIMRIIDIPFNFTLDKKLFNNLKKKIINIDNSPVSMQYQTILCNILENILIQGDEDIIKSAVMVFIDLYCQIMPNFLPMDITITSEFSYGCGLGSSASFSTVLSTSLLLLSGIIPFNPNMTNFTLDESYLEMISSYAFRGEQLVHGTPSGIDNTISVFGRSIVFQKHSGSIIKKSLELPHIRVLIVDTKIKRCTKTVVTFVREAMEDNKFKYNEWFEEINEITESIEKVMTKPGENAILVMNNYIEKNQRLLKLLGVSHDAIEDIVVVMRSYGISAKLTGAGWGGCVYGIVNQISSNLLENVIKNLAEKGYSTYLTTLGGNGVQIDLINNL